MAAIDKIYGTKKEYLQLKRWLKKNHPAWLQHLYPISQHCKKDKDYHFAISNFPIDVEHYLLFQCPLSFVISGILYNYNIKGSYPTETDYIMDINPNE